MPTSHLFTIAGVLLAYNVTRAEAVAISDFARQPVYWNGYWNYKGEIIGGQYSTPVNAVLKTA